MTAPIAAIGGIASSAATSGLNALSAASNLGGGSGLSGPTEATAPTSVGGASAVSGSGFANVLTDALGSVQSAQSKADGLAVQAATGSLTNVQDYMVAAEQANVETQLTVAVRNNAMQAFQQIMAMPL